MKQHEIIAKEYFDKHYKTFKKLSPIAQLILDENTNLDISKVQLRRVLKKYRDNQTEKNKIAELVLKGKSTLKDSDGNLVMEWTKTEISKEKQLTNLKEAINALTDDITKEIPVKFDNREVKENLLNQYTLTDYHLGMMAWGEETGDDWDIKISEDLLVNYFSYAIENSPNAESCIFAQIGDFLHWDGLDAVTPQSKHILDADTRFTQLVRIAIRVIRRVIKMLLNKYPIVNVIMAEGNHDMASSIWLRETLNVFYEDEPRVIIDTNPNPYYCITWGKVCLFYHHSHLKNLKSLDTVFVSKFKKEYGDSNFVYAHTGHLHHDKVIETNLMRLEQHRTLSAKDAYASRGGFNSDRDSKVITYHKYFGEMDRRTINIKALK